MDWWNKVDAMATTGTFYALMDTVQRVDRARNMAPRFAHSMGKLTRLRDVAKIELTRQARDLAVLFRDYIVLAVAGECRNANRCASRRWVNWPDSIDRSDAFHAAPSYSPRSILEAAVQLFDKQVKWLDGYGGLSWQKIAQSGLLYGTVPPEVFLDTSVGLTHNNGLFLDKGTLFQVASRNVYMEVLTHNAERGILSNYFRPLSVYESVADILWDALVLGLHQRSDIECIPQPVYSDWFVQWGTRDFVPDWGTTSHSRPKDLNAIGLKAKPHDDEEDEEQEEETDEEQDEEDEEEFVEDPLPAILASIQSPKEVPSVVSGYSEPAPRQ